MLFAEVGNDIMRGKELNRWLENQGMQGVVDIFSITRASRGGTYRNLQTAPHSSDCEKHLKLHKCSCFLWKTDIIYFVCLSIDISCCYEIQLSSHVFMTQR